MNINKIEVNGTEYNVEDTEARNSVQTLSEGVTQSINSINAVIPDTASASNMLALEKAIRVPVLQITARSGATLTGSLLMESNGDTFHNGQIVEVLISESLIISDGGWYTLSGTTANATNIQNTIGNIATGAGETKKVIGVFRNNSYIDLLYVVAPPTSTVSANNAAPVTSGGVYNCIGNGFKSSDKNKGKVRFTMAPFSTAFICGFISDVGAFMAVVVANYQNNFEIINIVGFASSHVSVLNTDGWTLTLSVNGSISVFGVIGGDISYPA